MSDFKLGIPDDMYKKIDGASSLFGWLGILDIIIFAVLLGCIINISFIPIIIVIIWIFSFVLLIIMSFVYNNRIVKPFIIEKFNEYSLFSPEKIIALLNDVYELPLDILHPKIEFIKLDPILVDSIDKEHRNEIEFNNKKFISAENIMLVVHYKINK